MPHGDQPPHTHVRRLLILVVAASLILLTQQVESASPAISVVPEKDTTTTNQHETNSNVHSSPSVSVVESDDAGDLDDASDNVLMTADEADLLPPRPKKPKPSKSLSEETTKTHEEAASSSDSHHSSASQADIVEGDKMSKEERAAKDVAERATKQKEVHDAEQREATAQEHLRQHQKRILENQQRAAEAAAAGMEAPSVDDHSHDYEHLIPQFDSRHETENEGTVKMRHWLDHVASRAEKQALVKAFIEQHKADMVSREAHAESQRRNRELRQFIEVLKRTRQEALKRVPKFWTEAMQALPNSAMYLMPYVQQEQTVDLFHQQVDSGMEEAMGYSKGATPIAVDDAHLLEEYLVSVHCDVVSHSAIPKSKKTPVCDEATLIHHDSAAGGTEKKNMCDIESAAADADGDYFRMMFEFNRSASSGASTPFPFRSLKFFKYLPIGRAHMAHDSYAFSDRRLPDLSEAVGAGSAIDWGADHNPTDGHGAKNKKDGVRLGGVTGSFFSLFPTAEYFAALPPFHQQMLRARAASLTSDVCMYLSSNPVAFRDRFHEEAEAARYDRGEAIEDEEHIRAKEYAKQFNQIPTLSELERPDPYEAEEEPLGRRQRAQLQGHDDL